MLNKINISNRKQILIVYIVLTIVTLAVYWQVNQFDFIIIDDPLYVTENSHIQSGISLNGVRWAFSTTYAEYVIPLVWLSFMFDYQLHGLNAGGYHISNLILHILSTLLLFWLFNRMTGAIWKSAFIAAFFAIHPMNVESVTWVTGRNNVLSIFFCILTLCLYVYYAEKPVIKRYLLVLFGFACALMSKPIFITLPVIMILLDYWPLGRFESHKTNLILWQLKEKIPFFILSSFFSIITIYLRCNRSMEHFPFSSRLANAPVSLVIYLEKTFWPRNMAIYYPFPSHIPELQVIGASLLIILISAAVIVMVKRLPYLFVGWFWYVIIIAPVLGIIQDNQQAMADRFHYLPSIGIGIMLAWGISLLFPNENTRKKVVFPAAIAFLTILSVITWQQCGYWKNSIELARHTLQVTKNNFVMHNLLAAALAEEGNIGEAIDNYNEAIHLNSNYADAYNNRGNAYDKTGRHQHAIDDYNAAIRLNPNDADVYNNRGLAYGKLGQYKQAIDNFNEAISLNKNYTNAYNNRGFAYLLQGNKKLGCLDAQKACSLGMCKLFEFAKSKGYCH